MKRLIFVCMSVLLACVLFVPTAKAQSINPSIANVAYCTNDGTTGTANTFLAKDTSGTCVKLATSDTTVPAFIVYDSGGTSGSASVGLAGNWPCKMDATASNTAGQFVIASVTAAGECHSQSAAPGAGVYVVGTMVDNSTTSGSTSAVHVPAPSVPSSGGGGSTAWSALTNPTASLALTNSGFNTVFTQSETDIWKWQNTATTSAGTVAQNSPFSELCGEYYTGSADAADCWTFQNTVGTGTNGQSILVLGHSGSSNSFNGVQIGNGTANGFIFGPTSNFDLNIASQGTGTVRLETGNSGVPITLANPTKLITNTVASLPSASSFGAGTMIVVTDATTFTPGTCTGGGSDTVLAISNGTSWVCQ